MYIHILIIICCYMYDKVYFYLKEMYYILLSIWGVNFALSLGNLLAVLLDVIGARLLPLLFGMELLASGLGSLLGTAFYSKFIIVTVVFPLYIVQYL